ncbi:histone deacetylase [Sporothrix stenoceras]|uniref:Histone deacetylase n=1 Tax=Sporothrix stenoceras TaxID=5173 RepID=A0ABR3YM85_9PEZI
MSFVQATSRRRQSTNFGETAGNNIANSNSNNLTSNSNGNNDDPLAQSLRQLSLSTGTPTKSKSPSPLSRTSSANGSGAPAGGPRSPSVMSNANTNNNGRRNSMTPRSPLPNGRESRAGTPGLLRKASMNSLHSGSNINGGSSSKGLTRRTSASNLKSPSPNSPLRSPMLGSGHSDFEALRGERQRPPRPPPPTAADIARSHFVAELARHSNTDEDLHHSAHTVVVLHDACYGHRFSRPRTSRANLGTIVERPERIQACAVGVSAAYVRLGGRHAEGGYMPHPQLDAASIPDNAVPFRIHKTARALPLQSPAVTNVHGTKWMEELKIMCDSAETKLALNGKELQRPDMDRGPPHHHATPARLHEGDLYLCSESLQALEGALGGVCEAVDAVFNRASQNRRAFVAIRPPGHHCSADWPSGFCWINNVHVGIMHAILAHGLTHAAIVDIDLHHGDGSQAIAWQHNARSALATKNAAAWKKTSIGYFSLHDINSFPCESGDEDKVKNASLCIENAHGQTVWNVHLEPWKTEAAFWALYSNKYNALLEKLRAFFRHQAAQRGDGSSEHGAIFISAGFDASEWESAGMQRHKVNVPTEFYARFTRDVVQIANEECAGRVISVLEGGYSDRALFSGVLSHVSGLAGSDPVTTRDEAFQSGLGYEMGSRLGALGINGNDMQEGVKSSVGVSGAPYDPAWWASTELDLIEAAIAPPPPPPEPKPDRTPHPATTYSSPTASSQAKVVYTPKLRRSMSGLNATYNGGLGSSPSSRPPSPPPPPPPEVPWTTAMHELSKLLIPSGDRTTTSCTVEDLSAEATRARRERQVLLGTIDVAVPATTSYSTPATPSGPTRVSMRERKQVKPFGSSVASSTAIKEEDAELDRKNRRKTVGGAVSTTGTPVATSARGGRPKSSAGRRLSGASTAVPKDDFDLAPPVPAMPTVIPAGGGTASSTGSSTRPTSAHSGSTTAAVRPDSSMSAAPPLSVRKARPTTTTGKTPRKKAASSSTSTTTAPAKPTYSRKTSSSSAATATTASTAPTNDDLDRLTSGMRKIKINVVTTAQKEAREKAKREKEAAEKAAAASQTTSQVTSQTTSRESSAEAAPVVSTPLPKRLVDTAPSAAAPSTPLAQTIGAAPTLRLTEAAEPTGPSSLSVDTAMAASSIASDDHSPLLTPSTEGGLGSDIPNVGIPGMSAPAPAPTVFIPYQPDSTPQQPQRVPSLSSSAAPLHWLPPNEVNTPMPMQSVSHMPPSMAATPSPMKRADLPVFTATSAIPFFGGAGSSSSRPSSAGLSAASASAASSRPATSSGAAPPPLPSLGGSGTFPPASPTMRPRSPTKLPGSPTKSPRKMQN